MSLTVDGLSTLYDTKASSNSTNKLEDTLSSDLSKATEKELMEVCKDFEAYFTEQMFKAMQSVSSSTRQLQDYYKEQMIQNMSEQSTEGGGLGLAQMLYEQMKRNYGLE